ncbi:hypothetical protein ACSQ67_024583 [Phaseolus vulgaris]
MCFEGENELKIKDAIEENKAWFEEMFDTIIPWDEQFMLPGTLIEVDEATMAPEELEYARFKIEFRWVARRRSLVI